MLLRLVHCNSLGDKPVYDGIHKVIRIRQLIHTPLRNAPKMMITSAHGQVHAVMSKPCSSCPHGNDSAGEALCLSAQRKLFFQLMLHSLEAAPQEKEFHYGDGRKWDAYLGTFVREV